MGTGGRCRTSERSARRCALADGCDGLPAATRDERKRPLAESAVAAQFRSISEAKKRLDQVFGSGFVVPGPSKVGIERMPIGAAQLLQCGLGVGRGAVSGIEHHTPVRGGKLRGYSRAFVCVLTCRHGASVQRQRTIARLILESVQCCHPLSRHGNRHSGGRVRPHLDAPLSGAQNPLSARAGTGSERRQGRGRGPRRYRVRRQPA